MGDSMAVEGGCGGAGRYWGLVSWRWGVGGGERTEAPLESRTTEVVCGDVESVFVGGRGGVKASLRLYMGFRPE